MEAIVYNLPLEIRAQLKELQRELASQKIQNIHETVKRVSNVPITNLFNIVKAIKENPKCSDNFKGSLNEMMAAMEVNEGSIGADSFQEFSAWYIDENKKSEIEIILILVRRVRAKADRVDFLLSHFRHEKFMNLANLRLGRLSVGGGVLGLGSLAAGVGVVTGGLAVVGAACVIGGFYLIRGARNTTISTEERDIVKYHCVLLLQNNGKVTIKDNGDVVASFERLSDGAVEVLENKAK